MEMSYQDKWLNGVCVERGERECANRFEIIRNFCSQYKRPFTVLDIGADQGYFGLRLTECFPECTVVSLEYNPPPFYWFYRNLCYDRILWLRQTFTLHDLQVLADVEHFDVVLGMSVIHHFGESFADALSVFKQLGDNLILELPFEDNACGQIMVQKINDFDIPIPGWTCLGLGASHLKQGYKREIWHVPTPKTAIKRAYVGSPREDMALEIQSTFDSKTVVFKHKPEQRDWIRGINLRTFRHFNGVWPMKADLLALLKMPERKHRDVAEWNIILSGDKSTHIDYDDPNHIFDWDDTEKLNEVRDGIK